MTPAVAHRGRRNQISSTKSDSPEAAERKRRLNRVRVKRRGLREKAGLRCYTVEIDESVLDMLVRLHWVTDSGSTDDAAVAKAIGALLKDAAGR